MAMSVNYNMVNSSSISINNNSVNLTSPSPHSACYPPMRTVSNGILQGNIPLNFALPLLTVQIVLVLVVTRTMAVLMRPLKQPRVLAEIIGGVLLGPTALGRSRAYKDKVFPPQSLPVLETVATMGLVYFIFMVGMKLDLKSLRQAGKDALLIAFTGIAVPFGAAAALAASGVAGRFDSDDAGLGAGIVFMAVPLSISAFSVLVRIMAEMGILATEVAKIALPSAAVNDVMVWILLAVGVALDGGKEESPLVPLWVLLCGVAFGVVMLTAVRKLTEILSEKAMSDDGKNREVCICAMLVGVLVVSFCSDAIGVHSLLGPFLLGLVLPKHTAFPAILAEKIDDLVTGIFLPLFFASSGLKTNLATLRGVRSLGLLVLFFAVAGAGKIVTTFVGGRLVARLPARRALLLGVLLNAKGLGVLIVLNIGKDLKALSDETFAILIVTCLLTTIVTTPIATALHDASKEKSSTKNDKLALNMESLSTPKKQLRVLACTQDARDYAIVANLIEASRGILPSSNIPRKIKLYTLHLLELSNRPSSTTNILQLTLTHSQRKDLQQQLISSSRNMNVNLSFHSSPELTKVQVCPLTSISTPHNMHLEITKLALDKRATMILLPHHKLASSQLESDFTLKVLDNAPCSVGILLDRCPTGIPIHPCFFSYKVMVLFIGGPDDREALALGCRMFHHPGVVVKVIRLHFIDQCNENNNETQARLDDEAIMMMKDMALRTSMSTFVYEEHQIEKLTEKEVIGDITRKLDNEANMFIVGRRKSMTFIKGVEANTNDKHTSELGIIGDALASNNHINACILVIQRYYQEYNIQTCYSSDKVKNTLA